MLYGISYREYIFSLHFLRFFLFAYVGFTVLGIFYAKIIWNMQEKDYNKETKK
jgi:hypothetical protein